MEEHPQPSAMALLCVARLVETKRPTPKGKAAPLHLALTTSHMWQNGRTIRIKFLGGTTKMKKKTLRFGRKWLRYANLRFIVVAHDMEADIRIAFTSGIGNWSYVGTECRTILDQQEATMNLELDDNMSLSWFKAVVLHEFGHALGLIHEHQNPSVDIQWDEDAVLAHYKKLNWDREMVEENVFKPYGKYMTQFSTFDKHSIMLYPIKKEHTKDGFSVEWNYRLSAMDKHFIAEAYPKKIKGWGPRYAPRCRRSHGHHDREVGLFRRAIELFPWDFNTIASALQIQMSSFRTTMMKFWLIKSRSISQSEGKRW
jgi:serralysin